MDPYYPGSLEHRPWGSLQFLALLDCARVYYKPPLPESEDWPQRSIPVGYASKPELLGGESVYFLFTESHLAGFPLAIPLSSVAILTTCS